MKAVQLSLIKIEGCQSRETTLEGVVEEYRENFAHLPPITVFFDGEFYWVGDGIHRYLAANRDGLESIECEVHKGDQRDAQLFACSANAKHGLRRTRTDKRNAVEICLGLEASWSNTRTAEHCGVSQRLVASVREELGLGNQHAPPAELKEAARTPQPGDGKAVLLPQSGGTPEADSGQPPGLSALKEIPADDFDPLEFGDPPPKKRKAADNGKPVRKRKHAERDMLDVLKKLHGILKELDLLDKYRGPLGDMLRECSYQGGYKK